MLTCHVRSAAKLSYQDAQNVIEGKTLGDVAVAPEHTAADVAHDIKILDDLAQQLRVRRFDAGALASDFPRITFKLDAQGMPIDCSTYERREANDLVEEVCSLLRYQHCGLLMPCCSLCSSPTSPSRNKSQCISLSKHRIFSTYMRI